MSSEQKLLDYLRRTTADLRRARRRINELETGGREPIALVAAGCRFPGGVSSPEELWRLVAEGTDAITAVPADRGWHLAPGVPAHGGFLTGADEFDPDFFGISPKDALSMDPQQRVLLEITWEAFERAGIVPASVHGEPVGVFVGTNGQDYRDLLVHEPALGIGANTAAASLSGRVSYTFGLQGPSVTVDTACSASLVALHLAARALRAGECSLALAGGVTVMTTPGVFAEFSRQGGLAADGRAKAFGDGADGTSWSEGAGVVVLERLSDARRHGHPVLAVLRGSAVNSDGASNGLTAPNGRAQRRVIRAALADAGLSAPEVGAIEAHGTGTRLGDPIEAAALLATYGQDRDRPAFLGSLKSNLGHTQAAAGIAGVLKMTEALRRGELPRTLHADPPSSRVDWAAGAVALLHTARAWPAEDTPRRAAVSAFGVSGTNAHVILEQAPAAPPRQPAPTSWPVPILVSGRDTESLRAQAAALAKVAPDLPAGDLGRALAVHRTAFAQRAVVLAHDPEQLRQGLRAIAGGAAALTGRGRTDPVLAYAFSGQGEQRVDMGAGLAAHYPVFADAFHAAGGALAPGADATRAEFAQPALFALEVALFRLLESWGVRPDHLIGHSIGEIAAAHVSGVLSLADARTLVTERARLMRALPEAGAMAAVEAAEHEIPLAPGLGVAAVNGPSSVVVSGTEAEVTAVAEHFAGLGRRTRRLAVSHAFHSPLMDPMLAEFEEVVSGLSFGAAEIPIVSTVTGRLAGDEIRSPRYWVDHVRRTVRFADALRTAVDAGTTVLAELGPSAVLSGLAAAHVDAVPLLRADRDEQVTALTALARLHIHGVRVDWAPLFPGAARVDLPTTVFRRRRFWPGTVAGAPLLAHRVDRPEGGVVRTGTLSLTRQPWLADHVVDGVPVLPGTAFTELVTAAAADLGHTRIAELVLEEPLVLTAETELTLVIDAVGAVTVHSRRDGSWTRHATGTVDASPANPDTFAWPADAPAVDLEGFYEALEGFSYGPAFRGLREVLRQDGAVFARVRLPEEVATGAFGVHPALLDAALHALPWTGVDAAAMPFAVTGLTVHATGARELRVRIRRTGPDSVALTATDPTGLPVLGVDELTLRPLRSVRAAAPLWRKEWVPATGHPPGPDDEVVRLPADGHPVEAAHHAAAVALRCLQRAAGRLVLVTGGELATAAAAGLVRAAQAEHPGRFVLVDTDGDPLLVDGEDEVRVRGGVAHVPRLSRFAAVPAPVAFDPDGIVLVAGGGLGALVARHLVEHHGVRHLLLLTRGGAAVPGLDVRACDVADRDALAAVLATLDRPVSAVVHAAGVLDDGVVAALTPDRLAAVLRPKVDGAWHLHELLGDVDAFVVFSSAASVLGAAGQGNYAAANAFLDALAEHRRAEGKSALSVQWGLWAGETGMTRHLTEADHRRLARSGVLPLPVADALAAFDRALAAAEPVLAAVPFDVAALRQRPDLPGVLRGLAPRAEPAPKPGRGRLPGATERELVELVCAHVTLVLGHDDGAVLDADRPFRDLGFDSLAGIELRNRLGAATGLSLPATAVFDHPTPRALARFLLASLAPAPEKSTVDVAVPVADDPVVIIGMACRYPGGVHTPEDLWRLLCAEGDAIGAFPDDRGWDTSPAGYAAAGGFLDDAAGFDAEFFGISPREATSMDPQQRILLEVGWEAVERAGIPPLSLRGSRTGVFAGVMYHDYGVGAGTTSPGSIVSGRIAYVLGLQGPALTIDTACSSSLVALHSAAAALRAGECTLALAGGVTVLATPAPFEEFARQDGLSRDGRCRSFGAGADGVGWAEGAGVLVLERLSDARRNGHDVLALVRGSAVNSDGASNGLTAPHGPAQQRVIRQALASAGLSTSEVDVVEAHGTGTALGDPIEAQALLATYGQDRQRPLLLGSVKSNLGHTQAAAGVAGVIKAVLAMRHGHVPATLHADEPSPHVDWSAGAVELATRARPWPDAGRPRRAGVSSFGISGTNAHVVLEGVPEPERAARPEPGPPVPWVLSASNPTALAALAERLPADESPVDVGHSLVTTRSEFAHRAVRLPDGTVLAEGRVVDGATALLFSGQGTQRAGMGAELLGLDLADADLDRTEFAQPALFEFQVALARRLAEHGVRPDFVAGHSVGEFAAAHIAGVFSLADARRLIAARGALMQRLAGGAMVALDVAEDEVELDPGVSIAAVNGPRSVVVSGAADAVARVAARHGGGTRLRVSHAFHSALVDPVLDEFRAVASEVTYAEPEIPFVSTVTGGLVSAELCTPEYWVRQVRETVRFAAAVTELAARGVATFLEVGPDATLSALGRQCVTGPAFIPALRREGEEPAQFLTALARAYVRGVPVDWTPYYPGARRVPLPTYPFHHERFWLTAPPADLLGPPVALPASGAVVFTGRLSHRAQPWLADHAVRGTVLLPGTGFVELARRAAEQIGCAGLGELVLEAPLVLGPDTEVELRVELGPPDEDGGRAVSVHSRADGDWVRHGRGHVGAGGGEPVALRAWPPEGAERRDLTGAYDRLALRGYDYGPAFRGLRAMWTRGDEVFAEVAVPEGLDVAGFGLHPALLDACLHARLLTDGDDRTLLPFAWSGVRLHRAGARSVRLRITSDGQTMRLDLADADGEPVATVESLAGRPVSEDQLAGPTRRDWLWRVVWDEVDVRPLPAPDVEVWTAPDGPDAGEVVAAALTAVQDALAADRRLLVRTDGDLHGAVANPAHAAVWGLVRAAQAEHPGRFFLVDGDPVITGEPELSARHGVFRRPRLSTAHAAENTWWAGGGTVLITGGTTGLGALVARHLVAGGAADVLLLSRRGEDAPGARDLRDELGVRIVACDVTDRAALAAVLAAEPDLSAVVHAAGVADNAVTAALTPAQLARVFGAKADGARHLHELTLDRDLTAFVLFSSAAGLTLGAGQGAYAAANAYLDGLASLRRAAGLPASALAWGLWADTPAPAAHRQRLHRLGMPPLPTADALALLDAAVGLGNAVPLRLDLAALRARADDVPPVLRPLVGAGREPRAAEPAAVAECDLLGLVRSHVAAVLGHASAAAIDPGRPLRDLGFDSLAAVELRNLLGGETGLSLPATLVFDHPTAAAVAEYLRTRLAPAAGPAPAEEQPAAEPGEPIAIIGMACHLPGGVRSPEELWELVVHGREAITGLPTDRGWDLRGVTVEGGGFLTGAADFDAGFFGISPAEAVRTDPQQRLLLEVAWEALERAGIDPHSLKGSRTGVFTGVMYHDYPGATTAGSAVPGRIAYQLGLQGPTMTVDTACSSSLVALHLASQSLRLGESRLALAGGVTVLSTPDSLVRFGELGVLSPDGRCRSYAAGAAGAGWAEGAGLLVLERLSDAQRNGHPVLAVVRGSAVNSDGASNGMTAPNGPAQQRVIRQALAAAGLDASEVDAVEGHGTGTELGDPIEVQALQAVYGQERPVWLGSVKSNLGHTQAAAGVAGVIKMVLALRHGTLPPSVHADTPSAHVDWAAGGVRLLAHARPWPAGRRRRAAVSSFGMSGINAHAIIEQAPAAARPAAGVAPSVVPWVFSAHSAAALRAQAARLVSTVDSPADVGFSLATTRARLPHRAVVLGADRDELLARLREFDVIEGDTLDGGRTAFLFSGQGSQRAGMGRGLYAAYPVFARAFDAVCAHFAAPVREITFAADSTRLDATEHTQPALFALEVALFRLLESWGLRPDVLIGHSIGELAAAHVAGILSLADACLLVQRRGQLMAALPGGSMIAVRAAAADVAPGVDLAAVNGPSSVVLSGEDATIRAVGERLSARGHQVTALRVSHAFHSAAMDPMLAEFREVTESLTYAEPRIPVVSGLTGRIATGAELRSPEYWVRHVRETVRFGDGLDTLRGHGVTRYLELGPDGALAAMVTGQTVVSALRRDRDEVRSLLAAVAALHVRGAAVDWAELFAGSGARRVPLPTYAFQRERYWAGPATPDIGRWRYRVDWRPAEVVDTTPPGTWTVLVPPGAPDDPWPAALGRALGASVRVAGSPVETAGVLSFLDLQGTLDLVTSGAGERIWSLTRNAATSPEAAAVWGLGRVAALEQPHRWGGLIDLPEVPDEQAVRRVLGTLAAGEDQVRIAPTGVLAARLTPAPATPARQWRPHGTVLVTGGTGALGTEVARWLLRTGADHVVLASRRGVATADLDQDVTLEACDVGEREAVARLLDPRRPLTAIFHAAGVLDDGVLDTLTPPRLEPVLRAKSVAAWHLHELSAAHPLTAFVLFSSVAGTLGGAGQAAYAAANAGLDALARLRRAHGLPATSIAWGPWAGGGMAARTTAATSWPGVRAMPPELAIAALQQTLDADDIDITVADVHWESFAAAFTAVRRSPLLAALWQPPRPTARPAAGDSLEALVREQISAVLGHRDPAALDPRADLGDLGFDSLTAVDLRNRLAEATGLRLPPTLVFDHPNLAELLAHLAELRGEGQAPAERTVLADLDRLEAAVAALDGQRLRRFQLGARLQALVAKVHQALDGDPGEDLAEATAEDLFEYLDKEVG
ncbi:type I polyketide synthase [Goodfellowiella coeruleoviolacea]|uniref:Acyl transferase domain-containing protein n=1 Tax=Goodfellowiella coeruleoviolacea TaxID=334858 RepID=A0AAE3KHW5_9PSEU|nr:type I polyketide synthase [Goodfellowiella coeruleoviolacea]MCP2167840.1 Acyl transferase domain-containing protein [Goodfellowiella coeruleoviolacea]